MALQKNSTKSYSGSKKGAARFARKITESLNPDCASIMIIGRGMLEDYSAHIVIEGSLADIERLAVKSSSKQPTNISPDPTPVGSSLQRKRKERKEDVLLG